MADDKVTIELVAKIDELKSGMADATATTRDATFAMSVSFEQFSDAMEHVTNAITIAIDDMSHHMQEGMSALRSSTEEHGEKTESKLGELTKSVKEFFAFEYLKEGLELFKKGLELIQEGFEATVVKAEEFGISNAKFAAMMGVSEETAAGLSAALRGVGVSAQEYEQMAMRMEGRVTTNEKAMQELGLKTRDASGALLNGKALMDSAIATMQTYKSGTDQNAFAHEVFGKSASKIYDIMRVGDEQIQHQIDLYKRFGVSLSDNIDPSVALEEATNDVRTEFDALAIKLGQDLMPIAQSVMEWLGNEGGDEMKDLAKDVEDLVLDFVSFAEALIDVAEAVKEIAVLANKASVATAGNDLALPGVAGGTKQGIIDIHEEADKSTNSVDHLKAAVEGLSAALKKGAAEVQGGPFPGVPYDPNYGKASVPDDLKKPQPWEMGGSRDFKAPGKGGKRDNSDEEAIQSEAKLGEARVAAEEATNAHLLAMDKKTADEFVAQATDLENRRYDIAYRALEQELALPNRTKAEVQKINEEILALQQQHEAKLVAIGQDGETKLAEATKKRVEAAHQALEEINKADDASMKAQIEHLDVLAQTGQITEAARAAQEQRLTEEIRKQQIARLSAEMATLSQKDPLYKKDLEQRTKLEEEAAQKADAAWLKHFQNVEKNVRQVSSAITGPFNSAVNDMLLHGETFGDAMKKMADSVAENFIQMAEQMAEEWIIQQITMAVVGKTTQSTAAVSGVMANTAVASTGAAAAMAAVPFVGPALAAAAATAMTAGLLGTYLPMASAAGGMTLDRDQLVFAHKDEMILPAHLSRGVQSIINNNGGAATSSGDTFNLTHAPTVNAPNANLDHMLRTQGDSLIAFLAQASRDGKFKRR